MIDPAQYHAYNEIRRRAAGRDAQGIGPVEVVAAAIRQHHHRSRLYALPDLLDFFIPLLHQLAHFCRIQGMRMGLVPGGTHMHGIAFFGAVHPEAHARMTRAGARAARISVLAVHANTAYAEGALGHAHPPGLAIALPERSGRFAFLLAGAEYLLQPGRFVGLQIGILRAQLHTQEHHGKKNYPGEYHTIIGYRK